MNKSETALLKLGQKYIPNNPHLAHKRMQNEIEVVVKKINKIFVEHGWVLPQQRIELFTGSLEKTLIDCHERHPPDIQLKVINNLINRFEKNSDNYQKNG